MSAMKKSIFSIAALALIAAVSCSKENPTDFEQSPISYNFTFEASMEESFASKAELDSDGKSIAWKTGDTAVLYFKTATAGETVTAKATVTSVDAQGVATFSANVPETADKSEVIASYNNAPGWTSTDLHPYKVRDAETWCRHRIIIPTTQTAVNGSFDPASIPLVGRWTGTAGDPVKILFKNPVSLLAINVTNNSTKTITSISVSDTLNYLSGYYYYMSADRTGFNYKYSKENQKEVTISGNITNGKYYFIIPGASQSLSGLRVNFYASDGSVVSKTNPNSITTDRNNIYSFGNFTLADADFVAQIPFSYTKVNMDNDFYSELLKSCTVTTSPNYYTLSSTVTVRGITVKPNNSGKCKVNADERFITEKHSCSFKSASSGNAELILYCAIAGGKAISMTWKDKNNETKTVPSEVTTALNNTTGSTVYYNTDAKALHLLFPNVEAGDVFSIAASGSNSHNVYKFYWKEASSN